MADSMQFDLVSPERRLASLDVREVRIPASEGQMTAMPDHAPAIVTLRPGVVRATGTDGAVTAYAVTGGFVEITQTAASVLAERAYPATAENRDAIAAQMEAARKAVEDATPETRDAAQLVVDDFAQLLTEMG